MLHLGCETPGAWGARAVEHMDAILLDHAHLEKKAASTALTLMFRNPDRSQLMRPLSELAREELRHFEAVLQVLETRGLTFRRQKPSAYAGRLLEVARSGEQERLMDTLLCCAFIEARSCERMKLLSEHLPDAQLAGFYRGLLASEARHHRLYLDLAETVAPADAVRARRDVIGAHEAEVVRSMPFEPRLHGG